MNDNNRRAEYVGGFTDLYWALLLLVITIVFFVLLNMNATAAVAEVVEVPHWEAGWLANSVSQQPIQGQPLLQALTNSSNDQAVHESLREAVDQTHTQKQFFVELVAVREGKIVSCARRFTARERTPGGATVLGGTAQLSCSSLVRTFTEDDLREPQRISVADNQQIVITQSPQETYVMVLMWGGDSS